MINMLQMRTNESQALLQSWGVVQCTIRMNKLDSVKHKSVKPLKILGGLRTY